MKKSNLLFLGGALTILLIAIFAIAIIWAFITHDRHDNWPPTKKSAEATTIEIKEVPVNVYIHDTVEIRIPCKKQHFETKKDTVE